MRSSQYRPMIHTMLLCRTAWRRVGLVLAGPILCALAWDMAIGQAAPPLAESTSDGFAVPRPGRTFHFPRDHGSHPEFKIEWWYITGHLADDRGEEYGFQATFFRQAGPRSTGGDATNGIHSELFGNSQIYLAHMAWLEVRTGKFRYQERLNREGWDARASESGLDLTNGPWSLVAEDGDKAMRLRGGVRNEVRWDLRLTPAKPLVVFGEEGVSRKAAAPTAASHYLTFPRLSVEGSMLSATSSSGQQSRKLRGIAWMDHEMSSSQLGQDQAGWDWASLQLDDGRELMAYRMRTRSGTTDPFSTLTWIGTDGKLTSHRGSEFRWIGKVGWKSEVTGAEYPIDVVIEATDPADGRLRKLRLEPLAKAQELGGDLGGIAYWEGACAVLDESGRRIGKAFLELTGYTGDLSSRFR